MKSSTPSPYASGKLNFHYYSRKNSPKIKKYTECECLDVWECCVGKTLVLEEESMFFAFCIRIRISHFGCFYRNHSHASKNEFFSTELAKMLTMVSSYDWNSKTNLDLVAMESWTNVLWKLTKTQVSARKFTKKTLQCLGFRQNHPKLNSLCAYKSLVNVGRNLEWWQLTFRCLSEFFRISHFAFHISQFGLFTKIALLPLKMIFLLWNLQKR